MSLAGSFYAFSSVALLAEGVDRNWSGGGMVLVLLSSPSSRRAWIEIGGRRAAHQAGRSPSSRRAWIEIAICCTTGSGSTVALLAEGVDRNRDERDNAKATRVALLAEGVDRNFGLVGHLHFFDGSPSSRRAWIEMYALS